MVSESASSPSPKGGLLRIFGRGKSAAPGLAVPPLYRRVDWLAFLATTLFMFVAYYVTLAPDLTLEDSGELAVGSYYAGVPHPPGYPVWTIFSWLFTVLIPVSNVAWRVALFSALSGALSCGLLALLASRGSSMMIESVKYLENIDRKWENAICFVSGFVGGTLLGFNGFMWSQAVIVEVYTFSHLSLLGVLCCLLRWMYAPQQRRYLYWAMFLFGICITNHQSLLLASVGIVVAVIAADRKLGRDVFIACGLMYILGVVFRSKVSTFSTHTTFLLFNLIGIGIIITIGWAVFSTKKIGTEWKAVLIMGLAWLVGAAFYLYMPLASMSNPPMNWGYPRTEEGFYHALSRGQYERSNPTDVLGDPNRFFGQLWMYTQGTVEEFSPAYFLIALVPFFFFLRMKKRERAWLIGVTAIFLCLSVLMIVVLNPNLDRQSRDLVRVFFTASHVLVALLIGYGLTFIAAILSTHYERFRPWALWISVAVAGMAILASAVVFQSGEGSELGQEILFGLAPSRDSLVRFVSLFGVAMSLMAIALFALAKKRLPVMVLLGIFLIFPVKPMLKNWAQNEQRGHMFGYWFGHDMFTPPFGIYPEMTRDAVLFGGTDPGRFCPTYMIFCESFIPPEDKKNTDPDFDRRDVYIITQNALADGTYLSYIRAHYNRSTQIDPPFFQDMLRSKKEAAENYKTNVFARMSAPLDDFFLWIGDRIERNRRAGSSFFHRDDFLDLPKLVERLKPGGNQDPVSAFVYQHLSEKTQELISNSASEGALARALAEDLNTLIEEELIERRQFEDDLEKISKVDNYDERERLKNEREQEFKKEYDPLYDAERFEDVELSEHVKLFVKEDPQSHTRIRLNRLLLEEAYDGLIKESPGGVYPDIEIRTPSVEDSQNCFQEYLTDAQRRLEHDRRFPNEPPLIKPGEDVKLVGDGGQQRVQVSGQVAVMAINGLLTKVIFDKNPGNEFFVEESFPLDWMFPHLSPYGIIMKINREQLPEITQEMVDKDHQFWSEYSNRLIGNWITHDTSIQEIADFVDRVYLRHDQTGLNAEQRKFARDSQAQKAFSKLRSSIGGIYAWRLGLMQSVPTAPQFMPKSVEERDRMTREVDFALKQAVAFCPYSPEAVFRYVQVLMSMQRIDDALLIAKTCLRLDPYNGSVLGLVDNLERIKASQAAVLDSRKQISAAEAQLNSNPSNMEAYVNLANSYMSMGQTNQAVGVLDRLIASPAADAKAVLFAAQAFVYFQDYKRLEATLQKLVEVDPERPEAWYDLAAMKATLGKPQEAMKALEQAITLSQDRLAKDPSQRDLLREAAGDGRFNNLRQLPEFQQLVAPK